MGMNRMKNIAVFGAVLAVLCLFVRPDSAQEPQTDDIIQGEPGAELQTKLEPLIVDAIDAYELPGLAIGVIKDNEIIYARGFGFKNIDTREPITISTIFHLASISKPFVATAIMQLVEQGKIDLEARIVEYLPYFKLASEQYEEITIQHMLSHISGMGDEQDYEWDKPQYDSGALERYVRGLADEVLQSRPGEQFSYSNIAFECLGDVIAKVSRMSFADYEKEHVLNPSGMKNSTFLKSQELPEDWASPHLRTVKTFAWAGYPYNRSHGPSSTLHSSVLEMCSWAVINMNRGTKGGQTILDPASYEELWTPRMEIRSGGLNKSVALSWFVGERAGERTISHGGKDLGFHTSLVMMPDKKTAVIVLCNFTPAPVGDISRAALDVMLGLTPQKIRPPASVPVLRTLADKGVEAALEKWNTLQRDFPQEFNFQEQQFLDPAGMTIHADRAEEAEMIARFCLEILSPHLLDFARDYIDSYLITHPDNPAAVVFRDILGKK